MRLITAIELANNYPENILIDSYSESGKYGCLCYRLKDGEIHKLMLSSQPVFNTPKEATEHMNNIAKEIKKEYKS